MFTLSWDRDAFRVDRRCPPYKEPRRTHSRICRDDQGVGSTDGLWVRDSYGEVYTRHLTRKTLGRGPRSVSSFAVEIASDVNSVDNTNSRRDTTLDFGQPTRTTPIPSRTSDLLLIQFKGRHEDSRTCTSALRRRVSVTPVGLPSVETRRITVLVSSSQRPQVEDRVVLCST